MKYQSVIWINQDTATSAVEAAEMAYAKVHESSELIIEVRDFEREVSTLIPVDSSGKGHLQPGLNIEHEGDN